MEQLPFLSKAAFAVAIDGLIAQLDEHSAGLRYQTRHSPHDPSDIYLEITRPITLSVPSSTATAIPTCIPDMATAVAVDEASDAESLAVLQPTEEPSAPAPTVCYHIVLSPIYAVPTLYLTVTPPLHDLQALHDALVPTDQRDAVRDVGVQGAISQTEHPYVQRVCWFVHPCRTAEAMQVWVGEGGLTLDRYLGLWLGVVGRAVGLTVPLRTS
ncbi:hypothetical protein DRE_04435 [Drechslerella stenobrocha 248]|uniref:Ubiquitin-like-conjugating enzyme ATG10 n=1 Tax=Drechslerella stenobrocha 248 TaxID=1043628 RepID=W7HSN8_9PEZI|nr:hypothetical protein DRE_04435 [Drechslerella stenobrocha 248]